MRLLALSQLCGNISCPKYLPGLGNRKLCNIFKTLFQQKRGCVKVYFLEMELLKEMFPRLLGMKNNSRTQKIFSK